MNLKGRNHVSKEGYEFKYVKTMSVFPHGRARAVNIPSEIVELLEIKEGDNIAFFKEEKTKVALIMNTKHLKVISPLGEHALGFMITKELIEKILQEKQNNKE